MKLWELNPGFPKVDNLGIDARIVLEQINSTKKIRLKGLEFLTLGLSVVLTLCPYALQLEFFFF